MNWVEEEVLCAPTSAYAQERKFMEHRVLIIPGEVWSQGNSHTFADLGYSGTGKSKVNQLKRNYYNEHSVKEARKVIAGRGSQVVTSVGISTLGQAKKKSSQGFCLRSVAINHFAARVTPEKKELLTVDIHYRTTEMLRKFGADLIFLHEFLIPEILKENPWSIKGPHEVRLHFATCFFSALFIPVFFRFKDPIVFLKKLKERGENLFYRRCLFRTKTMLERNASHYKFRSRRNMQELATGFLEKGHIDRERLKEFLKKEVNG